MVSPVLVVVEGGGWRLQDARPCQCEPSCPRHDLTDVSDTLGRIEVVLLYLTSSVTASLRKLTLHSLTLRVTSLFLY